MNQEKNNIYRSLTDMGDFYPLNFKFDKVFIEEYLERHRDNFQVYNPNKPNYNRYGLSLTSLEGKIDGTDLTSIKEYNKLNNTQYNEMSFKVDTEYFKELKNGCSDFQTLDNLLGRSHIVNFGRGGFFPPHRDLGESIRLIAFLNSDYERSYLLKEDKRINWTPNKLYFFNTKKEHSYFNFAQNADVLVLNMEVTKKSYDWIISRLSSS